MLIWIKKPVAESRIHFDFMNLIISFQWNDFAVRRSAGTPILGDELCSRRLFWPLFTLFARRRRRFLKSWIAKQRPSIRLANRVFKNLIITCSLKRRKILIGDDSRRENHPFVRRESRGIKITARPKALAIRNWQIMKLNRANFTIVLN